MRRDPNRQRADELRSIQMFNRLSRRELEVIAQLVDHVELPTGTALIREDTSAYEAMAIVRGTTRVTRRGAHLADLGPGDWAGEMSLLTGAPRSATVIATSDVALLVLDRRRFASMLAPAHLSQAFLRMVAARLLDADERLAMSGRDHLVGAGADSS